MNNTELIPSVPPQFVDSWTLQHGVYWDDVAAQYDSLYACDWSTQENLLVQRNLAFLARRIEPVVVDLGAGTCLGHHVCHSLNPTTRYLGVDMSPRMLARCAQRVPRVRADFHDLSFLDTSSVDLVTMLFSTFSFVSDVPRLLAEVHRVLRPDGVFYASALSRYALSLLTTDRPPRRRYRTRGDTDRRSVPASRYSVKALRRTLVAGSFNPVRVTGLNSLSGLFERPAAWPAGRLVSLTMPDTSHTLEALAIRVSLGCSDA